MVYANIELFIFIKGYRNKHPRIFDFILLLRFLDSIEVNSKIKLIIVEPLTSALPRTLLTKLIYARMSAFWAASKCSVRLIP